MPEACAVACEDGGGMLAALLWGGGVTARQGRERGSKRVLLSSRCRTITSALVC